MVRTASSPPKVARPNTSTPDPNRFVRGISLPVEAASASRPAAAAQTRGAKGARLRALVWDPVWERMPKGSTLVYVVPDSAIASVPFAALPDGADGGHLLDRLYFAHLTTAQDLMDDPSPVTGKGVLLVASQLETRTKQSSASEAKCVREMLDRHMFPTLPGSEREVRDISAVLQDSGAAWAPRMLLGDEAHERSVREAMSGRRILHLATHAWLDSQLFRRPANEDLQLIDAKARASIDAYLVNADPLLRTGLLLAPQDASNGLSDGYLTGYEVATLNLSGVELVVLSACDTAGSSRGGNGLVGLATAFREAGARSVVASLYPVADDPTAELMTLFYRKLSQGVPPALALTDAMRTLKRDGFSAYFWAPFVAYSTTVAQ
jgi:CHAT domain-containing protein